MRSRVLEVGTEEVINQFMWGYQTHFRLGVESAIEQALAAIGANLRPRVVLVGFRIVDDRRHPICVEPETGPLQAAALEGVLDSAESLFAADPESEIWHSYRPLHDKIQASLRRRARAGALAEAIEATGTLPGKRVFASESAAIGGYEVHTCVALDAGAWAAVPALKGETHGRIPVPESLVSAVVAEVLGRADGALAHADPGAGLQVLGPVNGLVREAAGRFAWGCVVRAGDPVGGDVFEAMDRITTQHYEGGAAAGRLIIARRDHPATRLDIQFRRPTRLSRSRAVRKLLETSSRQQALISSGSEVYGIGAAAAYDAEGQDLYEVNVLAHATWEFSHAGVPLMRVAYSRAALPSPVIGPERFTDLAQRVFAAEAGLDVEALWQQIQAASRAEHGTMVVVTAAARAEAERLHSQATPIEPVILADDVVRHVSRIDGALLLDPSGTCHAVGVILDGVAAGAGDPARGARYNSAVRYLEQAAAATLIVVVSEDGGIDLLPDVPPRIRRADVTAAVEQVRTIAAGPLDAEAFSRAWDSVKELAFYLDERQCAELNALYDEHQNARFAAGGIALRETPLASQPEMNESFFLEE
jgi:DisA bacterial checkpoint controller nucleotide-binding